MPGWTEIGKLDGTSAMIVDYCMFGAIWQKRTRFMNDLPSLQNCSMLGNNQHDHQILRGLKPGTGVAWTHIAGPYPHLLADMLAAAVDFDCGWTGSPLLTERFVRVGGLAR